MKSIYDFKKGDEITRVKPSKQFGSRVNPLGLIEDNSDRSYMGQKLIFIGIANGQIYCKPTNEFDIFLFGDKLIDLPLDIFSEGWDFFFDPNKLLEGFTPSKSKVKDLSIEEQLQKAIENEDYILAEKLKKKLSNK